MTKDEVYEDLEKRIISEELLPGQWIVEREISRIYNLSRTPVREILRKLSDFNLIEMQPSKGYRVRQIGIKDIIKIFQAREAVEGMATRLACQKYEERFLNEILDVKAHLESVDITVDPVAGVIAGNELHNLIMKIADNQYLLDFNKKLHNLASLTRNITKRSPVIEEKSKKFHLAILVALLERDADKGEQLMRDHLTSTCRDIVNLNLDFPDVLHEEN